MNTISEKLGERAAIARDELSQVMGRWSGLSTQYVDSETKQKTSVKAQLDILHSAMQKIIAEQPSVLTLEELDYLSERKQVNLSRARGEPAVAVNMALEAVKNMHDVSPDFFGKLHQKQVDSKNDAQAVVDALTVVKLDELADRPRLRDFKRIFERIAAEGISALSADEGARLHQYVKGGKAENIVDEKLSRPGLPGTFLGQAERFLQDYAPTFDAIENANSPGTPKHAMGRH